MTCLGSLTLPAPGAGDFVESILLHTMLKLFYYNLAVTFSVHYNCLTVRSNLLNPNAFPNTFPYHYFLHIFTYVLGFYRTIDLIFNLNTACSFHRFSDHFYRTETLQSPGNPMPVVVF